MRQILRTVLVGFTLSLSAAGLALGAGTGVVLSYHEIQVDDQGMIVPWYAADPGISYDHDIGLVWNWWKNLETCPNGVPYYLQHQVWSPSHDPRGLGGDQLAMALSSWSLLYAYSGDPSVIQNMRSIADYYLGHSLSSPSAMWPNLPYPYNTVTHSGVYDGDMMRGPGSLQPDKAASFATELVTLYEITGAESYLTSAVAIADSLAARVAAGDANNSPWPFRVAAGTGQVQDAYTTNWTGALRLFDDLTRLQRGNVASYATARDAVSAWLKTYPVQTNLWGPFFEDVADYSDTEINADTFAWYVLEHPSWSSTWGADARSALDWSYATFGNHSWSQYGATAINEQTHYQVPGNSHTARHWSVELLYSEKTGDASRKGEAVRGLNWATYMVDFDGKNLYPQNAIWLTDGYGDYVRHYLRAMGAAPELAPAGQNHLLRSSSVVTSVSYQATTLNYAVYDPGSREVLRIAFTPLSVTVGGVSLPRVTSISQLDSQEGYTFEAPGDATGVLRIRHDLVGDVSISAAAGPGDTTPPFRSNGLPAGLLAAGTTTATLQLTTNETATCKYSLTAGTAYESMTDAFATTGGTAHATPLSGLSDGATYTYYVRCIDQAPSPNANTTDLAITFHVATPSTDTAPPVRSNGLPTGTLAAGTTTATLQLTTDEVGTCKYSLTAGTGYAAMTGAFATTGGTAHSTPLSGLANGTTYTYYVRCIDQAATPNANTTDFAIVFNVAASPAGLVAAYGFNEGFGTTVTDASGNGNGGSVSGAAWVAGRFGGALSFNGTSALVTVNDSSSLDLTVGMTLEAWVNPRTLTSWRCVAMKERPGQLAYALYANTDSNGPSVEIAAGSNVDARGSSSPPLNTWSHLAVTYDGATLRLYLNGTPAGSRAVTGSIVASSNPLRIGGNAVWGEYFDGLLDEIRIYNRALTQAQIQADMTAPVGGAPADTLPPVRSNGLPTGTLAANTDSAALQLTTDEAATCKYSLTAGTAYAAMPGAFATTGGTAHSTTLTGLTNGTTYTYYARCIDQAATPNANTTDFVITFSVATPPPPDTTPPVRSNGLPTGLLAAGTTAATLQLTTNEPATCKFASIVGLTYASMTNTFATTGGTAHSTPLSGLTNGAGYAYYVRCIDHAPSPNANPRDFVIMFGVATPPADTQPPVRSNGLPAGTLAAGTTTATLQLTTDEAGTCKYSLAAGTTYASMTGTFATTGGTAHSTPLSGLANGTTYTYYVRCIDLAAAPNANTTDFVITFNVAAPSSAGLVAAYGFNEGFGTTVTDASGNGNGGSVSGAAWVAGRFGGALSFNGTSALVTVNDSNSLDLTVGMTLEAWVNPRTLNSWRCVMMKERPSQLAYALYANTDSNRPSVEIATGSNVDARGSSSPPLNTWSHLAVTYDGTTLRLYLNSAQFGSRAVTGSSFASASPLRIGGNAVWGEYFDGLLDEIRIYNRPLTQAEIQTDMTRAIGP